MSDPVEETLPERPEADATVVVYWRPGCPWCSRLLRWIDGAAVPVELRNIWDEPDAAAEVRTITGGDETVPTVTVGAVSLVNPSPKVLAATIRQQLPGLLPDEHGQGEPWWRRAGRRD
ncbi:MAG: glutaredoxin family protein [Nitriliruptoraceae bacterium]